MPPPYVPRFINVLGLGSLDNFFRLVQERLEYLEEGRQRELRLAGTDQASTRAVGMLQEAQVNG